MLNCLWDSRGSLRLAPLGSGLCRPLPFGPPTDNTHGFAPLAPSCCGFSLLSLFVLGVSTIRKNMLHFWASKKEPQQKSSEYKVSRSAVLHWAAHIRCIWGTCQPNRLPCFPTAAGSEALEVGPGSLQVTGGAWGYLTYTKVRDHVLQPLPPSYVWEKV